MRATLTLRSHEMWSGLAGRTVLVDPAATATAAVAVLSPAEAPPASAKLVPPTVLPPPKEDVAFKADRRGVEERDRRGVEERDAWGEVDVEEVEERRLSLPLERPPAEDTKRVVEAAAEVRAPVLVGNDERL